jgi:hypothetical protein
MKNVLIFIVGAAVGSVITWKLLESKYEQRVQNEVNELRDFYKNRYHGPENPDDSENAEPTSEAPATTYDAMVANYTGNDATETTEPSDKPYIISDDIFGEIDGYEIISLTLYSDGHLADDDDRLIEDIENTVGNDAIRYFDKYEEDSVYVRNDRLKTDFEILLSQRSYLDVVNRKPYLMGDADVEDT